MDPPVNPDNFLNTNDGRPCNHADCPLSQDHVKLTQTNASPTRHVGEIIGRPEKSLSRTTDLAPLALRLFASPKRREFRKTTARKFRIATIPTPLSWSPLCLPQAVASFGRVNRPRSTRQPRQFPQHKRWVSLHHADALGGKIMASSHKQMHHPPPVIFGEIIGHPEKSLSRTTDLAPLARRLFASPKHSEFRKTTAR